MYLKHQIHLFFLSSIDLMSSYFVELLIFQKLNQYIQFLHLHLEPIFLKYKQHHLSLPGDIHKVQKKDDTYKVILIVHIFDKFQVYGYLIHKPLLQYRLMPNIEQVFSNLMRDEFYQFSIHKM